MSVELEASVGKVLFKDMNWRGLRPLQESSFETIRKGSHTLITAGTASGKTEAALLPVLSTILESPELTHSHTPVALYIAPLKALINDIYERLKKLTFRSPLEVFSWHGDVEASEKNEALKKASILVTTPESLEGMLISSRIDPCVFFRNVRFFLMDELHALLDSPRGCQLASQIERLQSLSQFDIQKIGMSATIGNPEAVLQWLKGSSRRECEHISDENHTQKNLLLRKKSLENLLEDIEKVIEAKKKVILFTCSKADAEILFHYLSRKGVNPLLHHGSIGKKQREETEILFKSSKEYPVMIATTTLEMGIDIGDVSYVFFYSVPRSAASFMQRLGRAGRKTGVARAVVYVDIDGDNIDKTLEEQLYLFGNLFLFSKNQVEPIELLTFYPQILAHQILSMVYKERKLLPEKIGKLKEAYPFKEIEKEDVQEILAFLEQEAYLNREGNEYRLGYKAANMLEGTGIGDFVSVFQCAEDWLVLENTKEIGKVHVSTLFQKRREAHNIHIQNFYLAGKAWQVVDVDGLRKRIYVKPAESGTKPLWLSGEDSMHPVFSEAIRGFLLKPAFPTNCTIEQEVQDALLCMSQNERYTVSEEQPWVGIAVKHKNYVEVTLYTYGGDLLNFILGVLIKTSSPDYKNIRTTWKTIRWKAYSPFAVEEFLDVIRSFDYSEFKELIEEEFSENYEKIYAKIFQDRLIELVPKGLIVRTLIRYFWNILQHGLNKDIRDFVGAAI